jgi:unsaturated chondroitin disaccharide hydrolase
MIDINYSLSVNDFKEKMDLLWNLSGEKINRIVSEYDESQGAPVFTVDGKYATRGWTEWTHGFQFGSAVLQFDATGDTPFLDLAKRQIIDKMATHVSHTGVHDHGFNNLSTYGNLLRLMHEGKMEYNEWEAHFYELALKISGAVQAVRWTVLPNGGFINSFNGPHSLFVDTIRSCRILMVSHMLGHTYHGEGDQKISLLHRAVQHIEATAKYSVYYGEGRDQYDLWGRTAHESIFNTNDGQFRCPNSQQGYTGFSTWTRGLAWAMLGFSEELEALELLETEQFASLGGIEKVTQMMLKGAKATCDFYIEQTPSCGITYWDTGAPNLHKLGDYLNRPADPFNDWEPVDSSAAAIGAQGLLRLGHYLKKKGQKAEGEKYWQAGLTVFHSLLQEPYLSTNMEHHGLLLHTIYHQPNGWDHVHKGSKIANGESCMWGDYHFRELAIYVQKIRNDDPYYQFTNCVKK